jgi:hypothetical protein
MAARIQAPTARPAWNAMEAHHMTVREARARQFDEQPDPALRANEKLCMKSITFDEPF